MSDVSPVDGDGKFSFRCSHVTAVVLQHVSLSLQIRDFCFVAVFNFFQKEVVILLSRSSILSDHNVQTTFNRQLG